MRKKVNFILPHFARVPSGGTKVIYEYANRLSQKGYDVQIYNNLDTRFVSRYPFVLRKIVSLCRDGGSPVPNWYKFDKDVKFKFVNSIKDRYIRDADATVFTWWSLAGDVGSLNKSKGVKANLIQDYEVWNGNEELVNRSFQHSDILNISISQYITDLLVSMGHPVKSLPNAVDAALFRDFVPITSRKPLSFMMLHSNERRKSTETGIQAFELLRKTIPAARLTLFGAMPPENVLPGWADFVLRPDDLPELYNAHRFFISTSIMEGWGLPLHEAMQCGCAVICTDIPGHTQFLGGRSGAITYAPANVADLYQKLLYVCQLDDEALRDISNSNKMQVAPYSWENSVRGLEELLSLL